MIHIHQEKGKRIMPNASLLQPRSDPIALSNFFIVFINYIPIDIKLQFLQDKKQNL